MGVTFVLDFLEWDMDPESEENADGFFLAEIQKAIEFSP